MARAVTRRGHAKLNLALWVGAPMAAGHARAGFHPICSWTTCIDLFDEVTMEAAAEKGPAGLVVEWAPGAPRVTPIDWPPEQDLAWRAVRLLEERTGRSLAARVRVVKRVPVGAGLGGGSSDAAAALVAANEAFGLGLTTDELRALAPALGSDVAFFLDDRSPARPAIVSGLGERVERLARVESEVILVVPPFSCATAPVYSAFDELEDERLRRARASGGAPSAHRGEREDESLVRARAAKAVERHHVEGRFLFNALTPAAVRVEPRVRDVLAAVANVTNCHTRMTGSGSCVFLPVEGGRVERAAERLAGAIGAADTGGPGPGGVLRGCSVVRTRLV